MEQYHAGGGLLFGEFRLDRRGLFRLDRTGDAEPVALGSRALDLLRVLAHREGEVVSKEAIMAAVWPRTAVEQSNLTVQIAALRRALDRDCRLGSCIQTVSRRGYRFAAAVTRLGNAADASPILELPDKPSIAVLPFQNLSGDSRQDYFADAMAEEIITALSRIRWLFVIARNSSFTYKGKTVDARQVARDLGVRYLVEGSVRKAAHRVRISGQLIDTATGVHIWADRFDGALDDIFDLQDQAAASIAGAIEPRLRQSEFDRVARKPTESLGAYDLYLRALARFQRWVREERPGVIELLRQAMALDPGYAPAAGLFAMCQGIQMLPGLISDQEIAEGARVARHAVDAGKEDPDALWRGGFGIWVLGGDAPAGLTAFERALALNPNCAQAWTYLACLHGYSNRPVPAVAAAQRAMRLSPLDSLRWQFNTFLGLAHLVACRHEEALKLAELALHEQPRSGTSMDIAAAACGHLDRTAEGCLWVARLRQLRPGWSVASFKRFRGRIASPAVRSIFVEGFRKAGLPEQA
jgi:TolB-like protein